MDTNEITCPKCGHLNNYISEGCVKCGIIFSKYFGPCRLLNLQKLMEVLKK